VFNVDRLFPAHAGLGPEYRCANRPWIVFCGLAEKVRGNLGVGHCHRCIEFLAEILAERVLTDFQNLSDVRMLDAHACHGRNELALIVIRLKRWTPAFVNRLLLVHSLPH